MWMTFDPVNAENIQKLKELNICTLMWSSVTQCFFYDVIKFSPDLDDNGDPEDKERIRWKSLLAECPGHKGNPKEYSDKALELLFKWIVTNRHGGLHGKSKEELIQGQKDREIIAK